MNSKPRSRFKSFRTSLRARVALGIALPILLLLMAMSLTRYWRERQLLEAQIQLTVLQLGELLTGSLRHGMLSNDFEAIAKTLAAVGGMETVQHVQIVDLDGRVIADSHSEKEGIVRQFDDLGCKECHQFPDGSRPRTARLSASTDVLRISTPIDNEPDCAGCHTQTDSHLGVLLADVSIIDIEEHLRTDLRTDLAISVGVTVLATCGIYFLIHWLVVRRVETFRHPLNEFAAGDFTARLPSPAAPTDELGDLANAFNYMADKLERHVREQEKRGELRQRAIVEERERIARELHDGMAQLLGYVNTKAMAVRLMLKNRQLEAADQHLLQLEEAAREVFVDVREAILNLKMAGQTGDSLTTVLEDFTAQFSRLSGLPVEFAFTSAAESLSLPAEAELQLLRIVQESLTNVRKHASATSAGISLQINDGVLELTVSDNGKGFDPDQVQTNQRARFGLSTMRERAEAIGAEFDLDSEPGTGTCVTVRLEVKGG